MNYSCAPREEAADHAAAERLAAFSAPSPARTNLTGVQEAADRTTDCQADFTAPSPARTDLTAKQEAADRTAAFAVRFTPPA